MAGICRLCATVKKSFDLIPIIKCGIDILSTIETICKIKIDLSENNALPRKVCNTCIEFIQKIDKFSNVIIANQSTLEEMSNPIESYHPLNSLVNNSNILCSESDVDQCRMLMKTINQKSEKNVETASTKKSPLKKLSWGSVKSQCYGCSERTIGILRIKNHIDQCNKIKQNGKKIICGICRKKFISWNNYKTHITRHVPYLRRMYVKYLEEYFFFSIFFFVLK